jgi:hypothetical protein
MQGGSAAMSSSEARQQHRKLLRTGPFPGQIDPWAKDCRYFRQLHATIIGELQETLQDPLLDRGLIASCEASLQIAEGTIPDITISLRKQSPAPVPLDYPTIAEALLVNPGVALDLPLPELDAIHIYARGTGQIVTIIEIISPTNKSDRYEQSAYIQRREILVYNRSIQVVEIDLTRSVKRLIKSSNLLVYPYHIAIHLPLEHARMIGFRWAESIPRFALPLRDDGLAVQLQPVYDAAYYQSSVAAQMLDAGVYRADTLPFPSTLTDAQRDEALMRVESWKSQLEQLRAETGS